MSLIGNHMGNLPLGETRPLQLAVLPSSSITVSHLTHSLPVAAADSRYRLKTMTSAIAATAGRMPIKPTTSGVSFHNRYTVRSLHWPIPWAWCVDRAAGLLMGVAIPQFAKNDNAHRRSSSNRIDRLTWINRGIRWCWWFGFRVNVIRG